MNQESTDTTALAFIDVIANGFGCLLVLFFALTALKDDPSWEQRPDVSGSTGTGQSIPFLILITAADAQPAFDAAQNPWDFAQMPAGVVTSQRGSQWDWGQTHAVLLLPHLPPADAPIFVRLNENHPRCCVEWYAGESSGSWWLETDETGLIQVWPRRRGGVP